MKTGYLPTTKEGKLAHILEECGEVIQAYAKGLRFGFDNHHPDFPHAMNSDHLYSEIEDLYLALQRFYGDVD